jgi:hypothetical protein
MSNKTPQKNAKMKSDPDTPESHVQAAKKKRGVVASDTKEEGKTTRGKEPHSVEPDGSHFFSFPLYELSCAGNFVLVGGGGGGGKAVFVFFCFVFFFFFRLPGSVASGVPNMWGVFGWQDKSDSLKRLLLEHNGRSVVTNGVVSGDGKTVAIGRGRFCVINELKGNVVAVTREAQSEDDPAKQDAEDDEGFVPFCLCVLFCFHRIRR